MNDLTIPPSEIEIAELLQAVNKVPKMGDILRRLIFERDYLKQVKNVTIVTKKVIIEGEEKVLEGYVIGEKDEYYIVNFKSNYGTFREYWKKTECQLKIS